MNFQIQNGVLIKYSDEPGVTAAVIPDGVTGIGESAFEDCGDLTEVVFPAGLTDIGSHAFGYCGSLTQIVLPDGLKSIGEGAFEFCTDLTQIVLPDSVEYIGFNAFHACFDLTSAVVRVNNGPLCIEENAFDSDCALQIHADTLQAYMNCHISSDHLLYLNGEVVTDLVIPRGITSIPDGAFQRCVGLSGVFIPAGVTRIGEYAFRDCRSLAKVFIPDSVTDIGEHAFSHTGLTELVIPDGVTHIEFGAFFHCTGLKSLTVPDSITHFYPCLEGCDDALVHISFPRLCELSVSGDLWEHYAIEIPDDAAALQDCCDALDRISRDPSGAKYSRYIKRIEKKLLLCPRCAAAEYFASRGRFDEYVREHETDETALYDALMDDSCPDAVMTKVCTALLFRAFLRRSCRPVREWMRTYPVNPAMTAEACLLVWQQGDTTFTPNAAGVPVDAHGHPVQLTDADICLAHPMELQQSTVTAWRDYFAARHLAQPFVQLDEPVIDPRGIRPDRYKDCPIIRHSLSELEDHGITLEGGICRLADCEADQEETPVFVEAESDEDESEFEAGIEFSNFRFETYTRTVNHIVAFLDRCTLRDRIRKEECPRKSLI